MVTLHFCATNIRSVSLSAEAQMTDESEHAFAVLVQSPACSQSVSQSIIYLSTLSFNLCNLVLVASSYIVGCCFIIVPVSRLAAVCLIICCLNVLQTGGLRHSLYTYLDLNKVATWLLLPNAVLVPQLPVFSGCLLMLTFENLDLVSK